MNSKYNQIMWHKFVYSGYHFGWKSVAWYTQQIVVMCRSVQYYINNTQQSGHRLELPTQGTFGTV